MKIHVVKDKQGKALATFEHTDKGPKLEPQLQSGQSIEEMEVPERYISNLHVVYKTGTR